MDMCAFMYICTYTFPVYNYMNTRIVFMTHTSILSGGKNSISKLKI